MSLARRKLEQRSGWPRFVHNPCLSGRKMRFGFCQFGYVIDDHSASNRMRHVRFGWDILG
jgi:hypothetical protein